MKKVFQYLEQTFLSENTKEISEKVIISISILSFFVHLLLIMLVDIGILNLEKNAGLFKSPIAAIYTPFSFILIYEVYLLVFYLPKSTTIYIGKQYEIITLIVIRRIFKDLANLELTSDWFKVKYDLQFTYDIIATLLLFSLIYFFYRLSKRKIGYLEAKTELPGKVQRFINIKNMIGVLLVPIFLGLAIYTLGDWVYRSFFSISEIVDSIRDINNVFFDEFFTILILTDVLLLLFSFMQTNKFYKVIRNSGFVISTILIKISFSTDGLLNTLLIVVAVLFGVLILWIHNYYEKITVPDQEDIPLE